ncbi:MAG: hypothetical protein ACD_17C00118G0004 [uncultured bacterium]|nr:MAG: hypothetical protein ACD_17C00118G0004 [uncultured bacterium]OGN56367.1 MAG: hypothetical protein A2796_02985 [Chlamydiae bacterium RIFCSPHIGHO2_01_FULL_44_39]OGN60241.1 MAG: hypothetical protein A3D96_05355 [Chlamydiae bacterium RIFCSPHIGHO2_12_FULL_44_59]OGN67106.1 MAG: hypothetical protein A2978_00690 [Chlamydiae bacterium RIFCSPLOWO2_01_FULL_44_52]OGN67696.1 MAG: hypothetical protein A3I67_04625 [Chlamydiae bacterium RIFCSPLOWO2_02_FULL_45_22]OGN71399.1 MAG: hypothetical protein A3
MYTLLRYQKFLYFAKRWFFLLFLALVTCSHPAPQKANRLRLSFNTQPTTLDPRKCADFVSSTLVCMTYEGLTRCLPAGEVEPALADKVEISSDQLVYTFHLRKAFWSDGQPITAYDFEKSWKEVLEPPSASAFLFYPIKNVEKCVSGAVSVNEVGIYALNQDTLRVVLEYPTPYFYNLTAFPSFLAAPAHAHPEEASVVSGPYLYAKAPKISDILLVKNPFYWNSNAISIDEIEISIVPDESTALEMFENGELDWLGGPLCPLPPDAVEKLKNQLIFVPNAATTFITFNTQEPPFNNLKMRKAFSCAIDREEIVKKITQTGQMAATSILPPTFSKQRFLLSDLEQAKGLFREALEEMHITPQTLNALVLYYRPTQMEKRLAQTIQRQWEEAFGISIQLAQLDHKSHTHRLQTRDYHISLASWIAQFDDPISLLSRFKDSQNLKNYPGWEDNFYTRLLTLSNTSDNRKEILAQAELLFKEAMPLSPIYHWNSPAICSPRIAFIATTPCGGVLFERFRLNAQ